MKRFYERVTLAVRENGYGVELDGCELKTPEKRRNLSPTRKLAEAICQEWQAQEDKIIPDDMPIAKLQNNAIDRVETRRGDLIDELVKYAGADLLCYRAESPDDLARQQADIWQPLLDWVETTHGVALNVTTGIIHIEQDVARLGELLHGFDSFRLTAFYAVTTLCGSVALALNVIGGNITAEQAWQAAQLDENYQIGKWGIDDEARVRQDNMKAELEAAVRFLDLL